MSFPVFWTLTWMPVAFLSGAVPCGWVVGRCKGVDVRTAGSGNIGAANVGRLLGRSWGILVFFLDALKGFLPTFAAGITLSGAGGTPTDDSARNVAWLLVGLSAILGHNYSPFLKFRGGKGVATSLGVTMGVYSELALPGLLSLGVWILGLSLTRMSSVGSLSAALAFPVIYLVTSGAISQGLGSRWPFFLFGVLVAMLIVLRHRANLSRIFSGTESRFGKAPDQVTIRQQEKAR